MRFGLYAETFSVRRKHNWSDHNRDNLSPYYIAITLPLQGIQKQHLSTFDMPTTF